MSNQKMMTSAQKRRWRLSRQLRKRRVNWYHLEKQLAKVAEEQVKMKAEQAKTHALFDELERKVQALIAKQRVDSVPPQMGVLQMIWRFLNGKGEP
ncbi:hypothetical protein A4G19_08445 [Pasteurellaceae bacterium Macca]|nr:hypothetical protein [Pasteurellaceae bacterium Macca]